MKEICKICDPERTCEPVKDGKAREMSSADSGRCIPEYILVPVEDCVIFQRREQITDFISDPLILNFGS